MGQSKSGGYMKKDVLSGGQKTLLEQYLQQALPYQQQAAQGYQQFLPGGGGGQPIIDDAMRNYQQRTIPSILNAFGSNSKGSSALNQALAASGADLNSSLGSQLAQMQLGASQGLGNLGSGLGQVGLGTPAFAYMQKQQPFWQSAILASLAGGSQAGKSAMMGGF